MFPIKKRASINWIITSSVVKIVKGSPKNKKNGNKPFNPQKMEPIKAIRDENIITPYVLLLS
jgi:hypothetical protein